MTSKKLNFRSFANKITKAGATTTAVALTVLLTTASSWAQTEMAPAEGAPAKTTSNPMTTKELLVAFTKSDTNKDGKLSKEEAAGVPGLVAKFEIIDTDGDKFISKAEFDKAIQ
jgi:EF hand